MRSARGQSRGSRVASNAPYSSSGRSVSSKNAPSMTTLNTNRLYVGNLSWQVNWQMLKDHFKQCGNVVRADVLEEAGGRSKGCGIVEYNSVQEAQHAIDALNDTELDGRMIHVREDRESVSAPGCSVYVGNLSWQVKWQDLKDHFKSAGDVVRADVMEDASGRSKGCGIVEFSNTQDAENAIEQLNDSDLDGRLIFVREDRVGGERGGGQGSGGGGGGSGGHSSVGGNGQYIGAHNGLNMGYNPKTAIHHSGGGGGDEAGIGGGVAHGTKLYVGNLSWEVSWQDLKDVFRGCGNVTRADVITEPSGRSKGFGVVEMSTVHEANVAINKLNNTEIKGRAIYVREDRDDRSGGGRGGGGSGGGGGGGGGNTKLFVDNLAWNVRWQDLKDHFKANLPTAMTFRADVIMEPGSTTRSKGFGIIDFDNARDAEVAIETLNNTMLNDREMYVREDRR